MRTTGKSTRQHLRRAVIGMLVMTACAHAAPGDQKTDYLTLAAGAIPVSIGDDAAALGAGFEQALRAIDGSSQGYGLHRKPAAQGTAIEFVYVLPAETTFTHFEVPNILETPSPSQTFAGRIEIEGSATGPSAGYVRLAGADLSIGSAEPGHAAMAVAEEIPVRWLRLRLVGGIEAPREKMFFEFSELVGHGRQEAVPVSDAFQGAWKARGVLLELQQDGSVVTGCYDRTGDLSGTVDGNVLRATGVDRDDGIESIFLLTVRDDDRLLGVRSTNGAPFRLYAAPPAPTGTDTGCADRAPEPPGCGAVLHGIRFDYDSATLLPEAEPVLEALYRGLAATQSQAIAILGHTSSEGSDTYNRTLSEQRAAAVADWLSGRGIDRARLLAEGRGEEYPIASNDDETGRSMNRRVEIECR